MNKKAKFLVMFLLLVAMVPAGMYSIVEGRVVSGGVEGISEDASRINSLPELPPGTELDYDTSDLQELYSKDEIARLVNTTRVVYKHKTSSLKFKVDSTIIPESFENNAAFNSINWQRTFMLASGEAVQISVWNLDKKKAAKALHEALANRDGCSIDISKYCTTNFPAQPRVSSAYFKYHIFENSLVRVMYTFTELYEVEAFKQIANSVKVDGVKLFEKKDFKILEGNIKIRTTSALRGANTCGGLTDTNNPYNCCSSSITGQHNANCTWYAAYKRPDLKGIITQYPGGLWNQVIETKPELISSTPVAGALIVWELHVAYVESSDSNSVTWSEQNCYNAWYHADGSYGGAVNSFNAAVTKHSHSPDYGAGYFLGYILPQGGTSSNSCSGNNPVMANWNSSGGLSCSPTGTLKIHPTSTLQSTTGDINIKPR